MNGNIIITLASIVVVIIGCLSSMYVAYLIKSNKNMEKADRNLIDEFKEEIKQNLKEELSNNEKIHIRQLAELTQKITEIVNKNKESLKEKMDTGFNNFKSKLDGELSKNVEAFQKVLQDKKTRGIFGERLLGNVLGLIFGDKNDKIYKLQHTFSNGKRADAVIFLPGDNHAIAIDSKFPLENYSRYTDEKNSREKRTKAYQNFKNDMKKHISDIKEKYIIKGETMNQAMMFIGAESVYIEILQHHSDLIDYALKNNITICSNTTLVSTLITIQTMLQKFERQEYAKEFQEELEKISEEYIRFNERMMILKKDFEKLDKDFNNVQITSGKIVKRFDGIFNIDIN